MGRAPTATNIEELLEEASDVVIGYLRYEPDPVPPAVRRVVAAMVADLLLRPAAPAGQDLDADWSNPRPILTRSLKMRLSRFRTGFMSVDLVSDRCEIADAAEPYA